MTQRKECPAICEHCKEPIREDEAFVSTRTPTGIATVHLSCMKKGTKTDQSSTVFYPGSDPD